MAMNSRDTERQSAGRSEVTGSTSGSQADISGQAQDAASQAKDKAGEVADQAKEMTASRANEQKDNAADSLGTIARAVGNVGDKLRDQNPTIAHYADMASDRIDQLAGQISSRDVTDLLDDVEEYARRNPAVFLGGAFALGLIGARFLKSSQPSSSDGSRRESMRYRGPGTYHTAGARYTGRNTLPPRTDYRPGGYRLAGSSMDRQRRSAYGNSDPAMTTDTTRSETEEGRYGTR